MAPCTEAEPEECGLIAGERDHLADRNDGERRAGAEARGGKADGETAAVGEPFHRLADAGRIDRAAADAGEHRAEIEHLERAGVGVDDPAGAMSTPPKATISFGPFWGRSCRRSSLRLASARSRARRRC